MGPSAEQAIARLHSLGRYVKSRNFAVAVRAGCSHKEEFATNARTGPGSFAARVRAPCACDVTERDGPTCWLFAICGTGIPP
jgi:hypothetical protein